MDYTYLLEHTANPNITRNELDTNILYILCYHIETQCKYPFIQFMLEKIPFCNNLIQEEFVFPHIKLPNSSVDIRQLAINKVETCLAQILEPTIEYKGIVLDTDLKTPYILVEVNSRNWYSPKLSRNSPYWFVLTSEIINTKSVCNISISEEVVSLFTSNPQIGMLMEPDTNINYNLPDGVYTSSNNIKKVEYNSIFGNVRTKSYNSCGLYYYFNRSYSNIIQNDLIGINRYALFLDGNLYMEKEFLLTDEIIDKLYPEPTIIICYANLKPDILVKSCTYSIPLSYHIFHKELL